MRRSPISTVLLTALLTSAPGWAGPRESMAAAWADAQQLPIEARRLTRFIDFSTIPAARRADAVRVWKGHANQLSRAPDLTYFRKVNDTLYAALIEEFGWRRETWEALAKIDPFFHENEVRVEKVTVRKIWPGGPDRKGIDFPRGYAYDAVEQRTVVRSQLAPWTLPLDHLQLANLVNSDAPLVDAAWLFVQTARQLSLRNKQTGAGYADFVGFKNRAEFQKLAKFNEQDSIDIGRETRAAVDKSGVATQNRQVVRFQALTGAYWVTLDTNDSQNRGNAIRNLGRGEMLHQAEEIYLQGANGFFYFFLGDDKGVRQDTAPDFIGPDSSPLNTSNDGRIHLCASCVKCHIEGLRPLNDFVRRTMRDPLAVQTPDVKKFIELKRAYFSNLEKQLQRDREVYIDALNEATGWTPPQFAKAFAEFWDYYAETDWGPAEIARQMGVQEDKLLDSLKAEARRTGRLDLVLAGLLQQPPAKLRTVHYEEVAQEIWRMYLAHGQ